MENAREFLEKLTTGEEAGEVSRLSFPPHQPLVQSSFYEFFAVRGVRLAEARSDFISCTLKVPPRLVDGSGNLAMSAITNLIDVLGAAVAYQGGRSANLSADMSISRISTAKLDDELEIISKCLGRKGGYSGTHVVLRKKATGEIVAEGRHSLFDITRSKLYSFEAAMEKAREFLEKVMTCEESREVSQLTFPPHRPYIDPCFYEVFAARGVRLDLVHPDSISCSFKVPPRLLDINGNLAMGAITTLIDFLGEAAAYRGGRSTNVSTDMSISRVSTAKLGDELEIISRCLGRRGSYTGTHVLIRNKITGEIVAEGRHSVFDFDPTVAATSKL